MNNRINLLLLFLWLSSYSLVENAHSAPLTAETPTTQVLAAEVDSLPIYLSRVDAPIKSLVVKLHAEIQNVYSEGLYELLSHYLDEKNNSFTSDQKKLHSIIKTYRHELDKLNTQNIHQTQLLRRRVATRYLEKTKADAYKKRIETLKQNGKLKIRMPSPVQLEKPIPPNTILAKLGPLTIRSEQVESLHELKLFQLRGELFLMRKRSLEKLIDSKLLERAAIAQGKSLQDIESALLKVKATDKQIDEYIRSQEKLGNKINRTRVIPYINFRVRNAKREQLIMSQRIQANIKSLLYIPVRPIIHVDNQFGINYFANKEARKIDATRDPDIIIFSNYRCDVCRQSYQQIDKLLKLHPNLSAKQYDFIPLTDTVALDASLLANCADKQNKYLAMKNYLLNAQAPPRDNKWLDNTQLNRFLKQNRMRQKPFYQCLGDVAEQQAIANMTAVANQIGFTNPPAFLIHGMPLSGLHTSEELFDKLNKTSNPLN